ncbi:MAG: Gfo/Idh/MocA family protein [Oliverpabstia sp.]
MEKVKVGLVGLGLVSDSHIKAFQTHKNAEVVAVCDLDEAHAKEVAAQYGIEKYYTDYNEMLKDEGINLVDICTPTFTHVKMTIAAAEAKKNILCEKPFCMNLKEGQAAVEAAKKNSVSLTVEESYRFMTSIIKAKELIDAGEIGKPTQIRQRFGEWIPKEGVLDTRETTETHRGWRMNTEKAGGNGFPWMFDHCVHFFTAAEYLMDSEITEVYSVMADNTWMHKDKDNKVEMSLHGGTEIGDITMLTWSHADPACKGVWMRAEEINGKYDNMTGFSITVLGEKGMIEVLGEGAGGLQYNGENVHLILRKKDGTAQTMRFEEGGDDIWVSEMSYYSQAHKNLIHQMVDSILNNTESPYSGEAGVHDVKTTLAAICSAKEKLPVKVAEVTDDRYLK